MTKYDLDSLIEAFGKHAEKARKELERDLERFPEAEWLQEDFSISEALFEICREIKAIKGKLD